MAYTIPLYSNLIKFHNNIAVASGVRFITHDVIHCVLNRMKPDQNQSNRAFGEKIGCIEIHDNVFIGSNSLILYNTRIGPNAVVAAGSIVTKDVPPNTIVGGVPARIIGSFVDYFQNRLAETPYPKGMKPKIGREVEKDLATYIWDDFYKTRDTQGN